MEIFEHLNLTRFDLLVNGIRNEIQDWRLIDILFNGPSKPDAMYVAEQLESYFGAIEGAIFNLKNDEFVVLVKLGQDPDLSSVQKGITRKFPDYKCKVEASTLSRNGLQTIRIQLQEARSNEGNPCYTGKSVPSRKFFIIDDDLFVRRTLGLALSVHGTVMEFADCTNVVAVYKEQTPDIVFVDLHLPGCSGIEIMNMILAHDLTANIIIISADCTADNVLLAQAKGSKGFLGKPLNRAKIDKIVKSLIS